MEGEVIHLSDMVADLKQRIEALERFIAERAWPPIHVQARQGELPADIVQLCEKWDAGTYSEKDFEHG